MRPYLQWFISEKICDHCKGHKKRDSCFLKRVGMLLNGGITFFRNYTYISFLCSQFLSWSKDCILIIWNAIESRLENVVINITRSRSYRTVIYLKLLANILGCIFMAIETYVTELKFASIIISNGFAELEMKPVSRLVLNHCSIFQILTAFNCTQCMRVGDWN